MHKDVIMERDNTKTNVEYLIDMLIQYKRGEININDASAIFAESRAQTACFVICTKTPFESKCNTIEQMFLLSTFSALRTCASVNKFNPR